MSRPPFKPTISDHLSSQYVSSRSSTLLKVKTFYDAEAKVLAHHKGSGKNALVMGAIEVEMACGKTFKIGSGFSDAQRRKPPRIGSIVVYKFQELSKGGVPRYDTSTPE
jgi:DNA ligase 1